MLKLVQSDWGVFELAIDDGDDDAALATVIYAILFTDAEAPAGRVEDSYDRRGWYEDPTRGSGLWYVRRQALDDKARREAWLMVSTALEGRDGLSNIVVDEVLADDAAGNISRVFLRIAGLHNGRKFITRIPL